MENSYTIKILISPLNDYHHYVGQINHVYSVLQKILL